MSDSRTENAIGRVRQAARHLNGKARRRVGRTDHPNLGKADVVADVAREKLNSA